MNGRIQPQRPRLWHDARQVVAESGDGVLSFTAVRIRGGVHARRSIQRPGQGRVVLSVVFSDAPEFERWCEADRLSHTYPQLYQHLMSYGSSLFEPLDATSGIAS
jgi:hypothetical protein